MLPGREGSRALEALVAEVVADNRDVDVLKASGSTLPTAVLRRWDFRRGDSFPLSALSIPTRMVVRPLGDDSTLRLGGRDLTDLDEWLVSLGDQDVA